MKNDFNYKWSKLFASKRYKTKDGVIKLTPEEQQELLDDSERVVKNLSIPDVINCGGAIPYDSLSDSFKKSIDSIEENLNK